MRKLFKIGIPVALASILLAGCGAHHQASHKSSTGASVNKVDHDINNSDHKAHKDNKGHKKTAHVSGSSSNSKTSSVAGSVSTPRSAIESVPARSTESGSSSNNADQSQPSVNLGNGIIGTEDRGAGQIYISFDLGGWHIVSHGNDINESSSSAKKAAEQMITWYKNHPLPASGSITLDGNDMSASYGGRTINGSAENVLDQIMATE